MWLLNLCFALLGIHAVFAPSPFNSDFDDLWSEFMIKFERQYEPSEEGARRLIWEQNAGKIMKHNFEADMGMHSYRLSINKFADMTPKEMQKMRGCAISAKTAKKGVRTFVHKLDFILPSAVDWRDQGYVTQVKDQGACGSCWAFSAVGSLEGQHMATAGKLVSLSEQNLVDCSQKQGNQGCNGGWMDNAFEYVQKNKGIDTEQSYPYRGKDMRCKFNSSTVGATCKGYADLPQFNETALQAAAALIGPISVAIDASSDDFMFYESGIYNDKTCSQMELDHGVLVVGYGTTNGTDYWIVKNSWGMSWGEDGYILMSRNKKNQCGIATVASYPLM